MSRDAIAEAQAQGMPRTVSPLANTTPTSGTGHATLSRRQRVVVVIGVMVGMIFAGLDQTVVSTSMPRIVAELGGLSRYAWVFTGYMLAATVMLPIYGKLSDNYGRRPFFVGGLLLFMVGSALSGLSQEMNHLIAFRAIQGLGGGALMAMAPTIAGDLFPPVERARWQGLLIAIFGLVTIIGPALGGWITDNWGWRWVFYVNLPFGALALLTSWVTLPRPSGSRQRHVDYLGALVLIAAVGPLLLAFSWARTEYPWRSAPVIGLLAFAAAMFGVLFLIERHAAKPIIDFRLFRHNVYAVSMAVVLLVAAGLFATIVFLPLFLQAVVGTSATTLVWH